MTIASLIEYGLYAIATAIACVFNAEVQFLLVKLWRHTTTLIHRRLGDCQSNCSISPPPPPTKLFPSVSAASAVSALTENTPQGVVDEEHSVVSGMTQSSKGRCGSHHSYQSSILRQPSWASSHHSNQSTATKSCLKKDTSMRSNAKPPVRRRSSDTFQVNFEDLVDRGSNSSEDDADSWASDDAMTVLSDCADRGPRKQGELDFPKEILPSVKIERFANIASRSRPKETEEGELRSQEDLKKNTPSPLEYTMFAPKNATTTKSVERKGRSIDSSVAQTVGIRLKQKLKRHPSFDSLSFRAEKGPPSSIRNQISRSSQTDESSRGYSSVSVPPLLDLSPQSIRTTDSSDDSVEATAEKQTREPSSQPLHSSRKSNHDTPLQQISQNMEGRKKSCFRTLSSDQIGASVCCSEKRLQDFAPPRKSICRSFSTDRIDLMMGDSMELVIDMKARPSIRRSASVILRNGHDDAPKKPTRNNSNSNRPGLTSQSSSRNVTSRSLLPSRSSSSSSRRSSLDRCSSFRNQGYSEVIAPDRLNSNSSNSSGLYRCSSIRHMSSGSVVPAIWDNGTNGRGLERRPSSRTLINNNNSSSGTSFAPSRSNSSSNSQRSTLDRRPSSRTLSSDSLLAAVPSRASSTNSSSKRPEMTRRPSSHNLSIDNRRTISKTDRQILQRVQSSRDLFK